MAAGGGSRLFFRAGLFVVGPESASAHPGPVCYRKGKIIDFLPPRRTFNYPLLGAWMLQGSLHAPVTPG